MGFTPMGVFGRGRPSGRMLSAPHQQQRTLIASNPVFRQQDSMPPPGCTPSPPRSVVDPSCSWPRQLKHTQPHRISTAGGARHTAHKQANPHVQGRRPSRGRRQAHAAQQTASRQWMKEQHLFTDHHGHTASFGSGGWRPGTGWGPEPDCTTWSSSVSVGAGHRHGTQWVQNNPVFEEDMVGSGSWGY